MTYNLILLVQNFLSVAQAEFVILSELSRLGIMARVMKYPDTPHFAVMFNSSQDHNNYRMGTGIHPVKRLSNGQDMYAQDCGYPA